MGPLEFQVPWWKNDEGNNTEWELLAVSKGKYCDRKEAGSYLGLLFVLHM